MRMRRRTGAIIGALSTVLLAGAALDRGHPAPDPAFPPPDSGHAAASSGAATTSGDGALTPGHASAVDGSRASTGSIHGMVELGGTVRYDGPTPKAAPIDMSGDAYCTGANGAETADAQPIDVGEAGGLRGVVVYIRENVPGGPHPVPETPVVLDQRGCMYGPTLIALRAGQPLVIRNSDQTMHNVHVRSDANHEFNIGQPIQGLESRRTFDKPEVGIRVSCDIHGWMRASIAVFDHPFFALTDDAGGFEIRDLPAGEYVVEAWHPTLGTRTATVTVPAGGAAQAAFTFGG